MFDTTMLVDVLLSGVGEKNPKKRGGKLPFVRLQQLDKEGGNRYFHRCIVAKTINTLGWLDCKMMLIFKRLIKPRLFLICRIHITKTTFVHTQRVCFQR